MWPDPILWHLWLSLSESIIPNGKFLLETRSEFCKLPKEVKKYFSKRSKKFKEYNGLLQEAILQDFSGLRQNIFMWGENMCMQINNSQILSLSIVGASCTLRLALVLVTWLCTMFWCLNLDKNQFTAIWRWS